jgi:hypothetical protein
VGTESAFATRLPFAARSTFLPLAASSNDAARVKKVELAAKSKGESTVDRRRQKINNLFILTVNAVKKNGFGLPWLSACAFWTLLVALVGLDDPVRWCSQRPVVTSRRPSNRRFHFFGQKVAVSPVNSGAQDIPGYPRISLIYH